MSSYTLAAGSGSLGVNKTSAFGAMYAHSAGTQMLAQNAGGGYLAPVGSVQVVVHLDDVEGAAASHHITQGWSITRMALVTGLNSDASSTTGKLVQDACNALIAIVGDRGSLCPDITVPTYLEEFAPEIIASDTCKVRIVYKGYPLPTFKFGGALSQVETNLDNTGAAIVVGYTYPSDYPLRTDMAGKTVKQGGLVSRPVPEPSFTIKFLVTSGWGIVSSGVYSSATDYMTWLKMTYEGMVNATAYTLGTLTGLPRTWMCTEVTGVSKDGGNSYEGSFTIQYRARTWDPTVTFIDPNDGKPPADLSASAIYNGLPGYYNPQIAGQVAFPVLGSAPN